MPDNDAPLALLHALLKTSIKDELLEKLNEAEQPDVIRQVVAEYKIEPTVISTGMQTHEQMLGK